MNKSIDNASAGNTIKPSKSGPIASTGQPITREPDTEAKYLQRATILLSAAAHRLETTESQLHPRDFIEELGRVRATYTKNTWYQYKSSVMFWLMQYKDEKDYADAIVALGEMKADVCMKKKTGRTSSRKEKRILEKDYDRLTKFLTEQKVGKWARRAALFMQSSVASGLRPCEWENAILHPDGDHDHAEPFLHVKNAKATNGRANGVSRIVPVEEKSVAIIERHLDEIHRYTGNGKKPYNTYYHLCRNVFYHAVHELWPHGNKRYAFYSARHQFTANMKNVKIGEEVQGMLGHASIATHQNCYARSTCAWAGYTAHKHIRLAANQRVTAKFK